MLAAVNLAVLIIALVVSLRLGFIKVHNQNYIMQKSKIFGVLFITQMAIELLTYSIRECPIDFTHTIHKSLRTALLGVVGYTIFLDFHNFPKMSEYLDNVDSKSMNYHLIVIGSIVMFILIIQILELMFGYTGQC